MAPLYKISFTLFAALLLFGFSKTAQGGDLDRDIDHHPAESQHHSAIFPENKPELFGIHRQGRSVVNLIRILPAPNAKNKDNDNTKPELASENSIRRSVSVYLIISKDIHQSLTVRELLFPFHHFL
jgi:hypothetical protein